MKQRLSKIRFFIDHLSLRERFVVLVATLMVFLLMWILMVHYPQQKAIDITQNTLRTISTKTTTLQQKQDVIKHLSQDESVKQLLKKYNELQQDMLKLERQVARYEHRFISERQLATLLYDIMKQTKGVYIEHFSNTQYFREEAAQRIDMMTLSPNEATSKAKENSSVQRVTGLNEAHLPMERTQYTLTLRGDYFSIRNYLQRLEQLPWQLYWDKLNYTVVEYPKATVIIEFYTLRPSTQSQISAQQGKQ